MTAALRGIANLHSTSHPGSGRFAWSPPVVRGRGHVALAHIGFSANKQHSIPTKGPEKLTSPRQATPECKAPAQEFQPSASNGAASGGGGGRGVKLSLLSL